ncbi:hypothetical protein [Azospirillum sp.]|uniref:hypothetical protein n=1 Tax=Azospirillum sp. TaxID=34012 RepID=UPI003D71FAE9
MKGTPRSVWLSWANQAASIWTGVFAAAAKRNQAAFLKAMAAPRPATAKRRKPAKR